MATVADTVGRSIEWLTTSTDKRHIERRNIMADLSKRSQTERLTIAESLVSSVWEEFLNGSIDEENLQIAVDLQVNVNRIVWKLNEVRDEKK